MPATTKTNTLTFRTSEVQAHVAHALAAGDHRPLYGQARPGPALWWVKDDGTYIMSNGTGERPDTAYAIGYSPNVTDVWDRCREVCGGDDFCELIVDLVADTKLVEALKTADPAGLVKLHVRPDEVTIEVS